MNILNKVVNIFNPVKYIILSLICNFAFSSQYTNLCPSDPGKQDYVAKKAHPTWYQISKWQPYGRNWNILKSIDYGKSWTSVDDFKEGATSNAEWIYQKRKVTYITGIYRYRRTPNRPILRAAFDDGKTWSSLELNIYGRFWSTHSYKDYIYLVGEQYYDISYHPQKTAKSRLRIWRFKPKDLKNLKVLTAAEDVFTHDPIGNGLIESYGKILNFKNNKVVVYGCSRKSNEMFKPFTLILPNI